MAPTAFNTSPACMDHSQARQDRTNCSRAGKPDLGPRRQRRHTDEIGTLAALLLGPDGAFITGSDFLIDGGVTASYFYGELAPSRNE